MFVRLFVFSCFETKDTPRTARFFFIYFLAVEKVSRPDFLLSCILFFFVIARLRRQIVFFAPRCRMKKNNVLWVGHVPEYSGRYFIGNYAVRLGTASVPYRVATTGMVRYELGTGTRHFGWCIRFARQKYLGYRYTLSRMPLEILACALCWFRFSAGSLLLLSMVPPPPPPPSTSPVLCSGSWVCDVCVPLCEPSAPEG